MKANQQQQEAVEHWTPPQCRGHCELCANDPGAWAANNSCSASCGGGSRKLERRQRSVVLGKASPVIFSSERNKRKGRENVGNGTARLTSVSLAVVEAAKEDHDGKHTPSPLVIRDD